MTIRPNREERVARCRFYFLNRLSGFIGWCWFYLFPLRRRVARQNLQVAFPNRPGLVNRLCRQHFTHMVLTILETLAMGRGQRQQLSSHFVVRGMENYERASARGRGVVVVTAHLGNFDKLACAYAEKGVPLAIVSETLRHRGLNRLWMGIRSGRGVTIFYGAGVLRRSLGWLREGKVLGLVVDQRIGRRRGGILVPFMGRQVWTSPLCVRLAEQTGAALLPVFVQRRLHKHVVTICPEVIPAVSGPKMDVFTTLSRINEIVEHHIRLAPSQWLWIHRRFKDGWEVDVSKHSLE